MTKYLTLKVRVRFHAIEIEEKSIEKSIAKFEVFLIEELLSQFPDLENIEAISIDATEWLIEALQE